MIKDLMNKALKHALGLGPQYVEVKAQEYVYEFIRVNNGVLKEYSKSNTAGIGVRVLYDGRLGFSSTNILREEEILKSVEESISAAKASEDRVELADREVRKDRKSSVFSEDPEGVPEEEKVKVVMEANNAARTDESIKSSTTYLGILKDKRYLITSDGADLKWSVVMTGLAQVSVAAEAGGMERVHDSRSRVAGWEFIRRLDWNSFTEGVSTLAKEALKAKQPPAGKLRVIADPDLIGLILHEAFGHASEGDLVGTGNSVLQGKVGDEIASPQVSIVDDGLVEGGYYVPYDDEGNPKVRTVIVDDGILKHFLTGRVWASRLGMSVTGNGRAQDFKNPPIVRQTNLYMLAGDWSKEEMIRELKDGLYLTGKGAGGGEVDPSAGTFTFSVGPSRIVRNGELGELVKGTIVSGYILETLKGVEAVGKDAIIKTSVFGGCGKDGQLVRVGYGGPHVMIKAITVGGR